MFDAPIDAWYLWIGVAVVSIAVFSLAASLPTSPTPDAAAVANTVDAVAADSHESMAEHPITAESIKLGANGVALRSGDVTARATFAYGPVTPVEDGTLLWEVAQGAPPSHVFESPSAFRRSARDARDRIPDWKRADSRITVRRVSWEGVDATLVDR